MIAGGVIGPLKQPEVLIAGRYRGQELVQVGRRRRADLPACRSRSIVVVSEIELSASVTVFN